VAKSRRSLALSNTPTYPDVRTTLAHDERAVSLALALAADSGPKLARGFIPMGETHAGGVAVVKEGNEHCGNGVRRWNFGDEDGSGILRRVPGSLEGIIEPFVEGLSQRILAMKYSTYHLKYESEDWRKNVNSKVQVANVAGFSLSDRANEIADKLKLHPVGIDFLIAKEATYLLEVNAYPGFDDVPEAKKDFIACIEEWWRGVSEDDGA
jgi:glutathione synthase/RimK-type ligase-like ATP-grasp enzyme